MTEVPNAVVVVCAFVAAAVVLGALVFGPPALATQRLQIEGERVRDEALDAYLEGDIPDTDQEALLAFIHFCHIVTDHTRDLRLGRYKSLELAVRLHATPGTGVPAPADAGETSLTPYEHELDELVGDYFIHGSRMWWALAPARAAWRVARKLLHVETPLEASAYQQAVELREEITDPSSEAAAFRDLIVGGERHLTDGDLLAV